MKLLSKIWAIINQPLMWIGTVCSIASVVIAVMYRDTAAWVALGILCLSLLLILIALLRVLNKYLEEDKNGNYRCISSIVTYKTDDGKHISFEMCRFIQAKCAIMQEFDTGFKWTGTEEPQWKSKLQEIVRVEKATDIGKYNSLILRFRNPLLYNQTAVVQYKAEIDDSDQKSETYAEIKVEYPTDYVRILVELPYENHPEAKLLRKLIYSVSPSEFIEYEKVVYDSAHKHYRCDIPNPKPGYFYRLSWER